MSAVTLLGIGGVALLAAWATTPEFRQNKELVKPDTLDDMSVSESLIKNYQSGRNNQLSPPAHMDGSPMMTGNAPAWSVPLGAHSSKWWENDEGTATAAYLHRCCTPRFKNVRADGAPPANPQRDQPCYDPYTPDPDKRGVIRRAVDNAF